MLNCLSELALPQDLRPLVRSMCDRHFGVGADGVLILRPGYRTAVAMDIVNVDGSDGDMCGNGLRCAARSLTEAGTIPIETPSRIVQAQVLGNEVEIDMGPYSLLNESIGLKSDVSVMQVPLSRGRVGVAVSMGNPHLVVFGEGDLMKDGPTFEHHSAFRNRTNVNFVTIESENRICVHTWERGAGATLACGTGACAAAVTSFLTNRTGSSVSVRVPGGELYVSIRSDHTVAMRGEAALVFRGIWP